MPMPPAPMPMQMPSTSPTAPPPAPPPIIMPGLPPPPQPPAPIVPAAPPGPGPAAAAKPGAESVLEWEDEEMATQIYDKQDLGEAGKVAGLAIDTSTLSTTAAPVPARAGAAPARPAKRTSHAPFIAAAILIVAVIVVVLIIAFGGKKEEGKVPPVPAPDAAPLVVMTEHDAGSSVPVPTADGGMTTVPPGTDAGNGTPAPEAGAADVARQEVDVLLAEDLRTAKIFVDGTETPWSRVLKLAVPESGSSLLRIEWAGRQCKETVPGGCPEWKIEPTTSDLEITAAMFVGAPMRLALQGTLIEGAGLAIQTEGTASYISLLPGPHTLVIRKEGFPDFELPALTVPENAAEVQPVPIPLLVAFEITSTPRECHVLLARGSAEPEAIGDTGHDPLRLLLDRAQSYRIRVTKPGFRSFEEAVTFEEGRATLAMAPELDREGGGGHPHPPPPPPGQMGKLTVITQPWTMVYVNGRRVKQTPLLNHELPAGRYQLTLLNQDVGIRHTEMVIIQAGRTTMIRRTQDQMR
jgi:hypothetical protein